MNECENQIQELLESQIRVWTMARDNYNALSDVVVRSISFGDHFVRLQYNPKRIISSAAKVDPKSLSERPCFLCGQNRPAEQKGITYLNKFHILVNPYPVFDPHYTVSSIEHLPQQISGNFEAMLSLARDLPGFVIIYNGPECGASAPDHFHFQAIPKNIMPVEDEYKGRLQDQFNFSAQTQVHPVTAYSRRMLAIKSSNRSDAVGVFNAIYKILEDLLPTANEPMMNILTWFEDGKWIILIFPRKRHRPAQYFEIGAKQILISPASIDMGGVLIIPRKEDYDKISKPDIKDIFNQVCVDESFITLVINRIKSEL